MGSVKLERNPKVEVRDEEEAIVVTVDKKYGVKELLDGRFEGLLKKFIELTIAHKPFEINYDDKGETQISVKGVNETKEPTTLSVGEAADILGVSTQLVRRYCREGKITGTQTLGTSGKWTITVDEKIKNLPKWSEYQGKRKILKDNSKKTAETLLAIIDERKNIEK